MRGKALKWKGLKRDEAHRRSVCMRARSRREIPSSRQGKLEQKRDATRGSRKERTRQEGGRNLNYPGDFGAREPRHATLWFPMAERLPSWRPCSCGKRTSLRDDAEKMLPDAVSIAHSEIRPPAGHSKTCQKRERATAKMGEFSVARSCSDFSSS
jgi:hypothetical protein